MHLHWPEVVGGCHEVLTENRDPFDISLPLRLEVCRGYRVGRFQKGAEER